MRLSGTLARSISTSRGLGNLLWDLAGSRPSLDLRFAERKSLVDATTGTNLIDFTRAGSGTYVGSDRLIKTATTNLLLRSEEFDDAVWGNVNGTVTRNANATAAPNGTLTADELVFPSADVGVAQNLTILSGVTYTVSIWIKGTAGQTIRFTANSIPVPLDAPSNVTLTGEWTRYSFTNVSTGTSASLNLSTFGGATARSIYVWGAQLEQSSTVGEYIPTTSTINSAPRFDHDPATGESLGLLVEESRVNNALQSESVTTSPWGALGSPTFTINNAISPAGSLTADLVVGNNSEAFAGAAQILSSLVIGNSYSLSLFVKPNTDTTTRLGLFNAATTLWNFYVDIAWTAGIPSTQSTFGDPINVQYQSYGNGWYRCSLTGGIDTTTPQFIFQPDLTATSKSAWIWGASVESGSAGASAVFPTSYIPTTTSAVTRAADVPVDTTRGAAIRSLYAEFRSPASGTRPIVSLDDGTTSERIELLTSGTDPKLLVTDGGNAQADLDTGLIAANTTARLAARFDTNNFAASVSGDAEVTDTTGTMPTVNRIRIGRNQAGNCLNGTIARITGWDSPLPALSTITR